MRKRTWTKSWTSARTKSNRNLLYEIGQTPSPAGIHVAIHPPEREPPREAERNCCDSSVVVQHRKCLKIFLGIRILLSDTKFREKRMAAVSLGLVTCMPDELEYM